jgi:hypothetical protein
MSTPSPCSVAQGKGRNTRKTRTFTTEDAEVHGGNDTEENKGF